MKITIEVSAQAMRIVRKVKRTGFFGRTDQETIQRLLDLKLYESAATLKKKTQRSV